MSDANYQTKVFWYLPACVATEVGLQPPPPVYLADPVNIDSDENNSLRRYAALLRQEPFVMETAAKCIEDLANSVVGRYPLLDVAACLQNGGPAVGPGVHHQPRVVGQNLEAAANDLRLWLTDPLLSSKGGIVELACAMVCTKQRLSSGAKGSQ